MPGNATFWTIIGISITTAVLHTFTGPDHYLPFIALARSRNWKLGKTLLLTLVSGLGHVGSAILLAVLFHIFRDKLADHHLEQIENIRGSLAAWLLTILGAIYLLWGVWHQWRHTHTHTHTHIHLDGTVHTHEHASLAEHAHVHGDSDHRLLLGWSLFIIFVLGPCEALLPILAAAAAVSKKCLFSSTIIFSTTTILTMLTAVGIGYYGTKKVTSPILERYSHILAGLVNAGCGLGMIFLGL